MSSPFVSTHDSLLAEELSEGITYYRFQRTAGWEIAHPDNSAIHSILSLMKDGGAFTVIRIANARTKTVSPSSGVETSLEIVRDLRGPFVAINGGFFIHLPKLFRGEDGFLLPDDKVTQTVGPTSATELTGQYVEVPPAYADHLKRREMTDGSFYYAGPSLGQPLAVTTTNFDRINTSEGRFNYFARDPEGNTIASPVWASLKEWELQRQENEASKDFQAATTMRTDTEDAYLVDAMKRKAILSDGTLQYASAPPANKFVKGFWAQKPGNFSHVNEPNERAGILRGEGAWYFFTYTSQREEGVIIDAFGDLAKAFAAHFEKMIPTGDEIWANDGGPSIGLMFVDHHGAIRLLAQGGLAKQSLPIPVDPKMMRQVPNMVAAWHESIKEEA
ncbi:hypothetical protein [Agrobacterium tumefaciens]|uniref:hypothetical protein n=1 Tax=Agrobacterium tumefaciens TaxID=358 RepID=UPI002243EA71|nr:hypothetical protein [Agrobacterium tumefaciens]MCW8059635.1 hypothetical protein [Agrobacterium tumefaciens]MCW8146263.1 hypothetical protein [Agrobacterium tumefaciens]